MTTPIFPDLKDASVFITGGGNGIGAALTEGFLRQGAKVAFVGRSDATGFANDMAIKTGIRPLFIQCDVTDTDALHAAMDQAATTHGAFTATVNNAANDMRYDAQDVTPQIWDDMIAVNQKAYFFACQKAASLMENGGSIVNYSSISYMMGIAGLSTYISANAAITGMTRSLAREWGPRGIRVNAIAPGWVLTDKQKKLWATDEGLQGHMNMQCLKEHMSPEDMVAPTLFLASSASRMMTGQVMAVDAGVVTTG